MYKIISGSMIYINEKWRKMYYSHINIPCWKVLLDDNSIITIAPNFNISAYYVDTFCSYKGYKCQILDIKNNIAYLNPSVEYQSMSKDYAKHGYDPRLEVKENEVEEIWEDRKPIAGFRFDVAPIYYIKKKKNEK